MRKQKKGFNTAEEAYEEIIRSLSALKYLKQRKAKDLDDEYDKEIRSCIDALIKPYSFLVERIKAKKRWDIYIRKRIEKENKEWEGMPSMENL
jgi:hypothetical protein